MIPIPLPAHRIRRPPLRRGRRDLRVVGDGVAAARGELLRRRQAVGAGGGGGGAGRAGLDGGRDTAVDDFVEEVLDEGGRGGGGEGEWGKEEGEEEGGLHFGLEVVVVDDGWEVGLLGGCCG